MGQCQLLQVIGPATKITYHKQRAFEPVRLAVAKEVANDEYRQDEQSNHEDLKVEVHGLTQGPADNDDKGAVEQGSLDRRAEAVVESHVDGAVWERRQY